VKLVRSSRRLALIFACALAVPFSFATPANAMGSSEVNSCQDPGLDLPPQAKPKSPDVASAPDSTAASDPNSCDPTNACCADPASSVAPAAPASSNAAPASSSAAPASKAPTTGKSDVTVSARDVDTMRRRAAEERRLLEELHALRQKDPVEFDRRLKEETAKLDAEDAARAARARNASHTGVGGATTDAVGPSLTDELSQLAEGKDPAAPVAPVSSAPTKPTAPKSNPIAPVATVDAGLPAPTLITTPIGIGNATPLSVPGPSLGAAQPLGGANPANPMNALGTPGAPVPWWQMFLMKLLDVAGSALSQLMTRKLDGLQSDAGSSPKLNNAIKTGWNGAGTNSSFNLPTGSTVPISGVPMSGAPISSTPVSGPISSPPISSGPIVSGPFGSATPITLGTTTTPTSLPPLVSPNGTTTTFPKVTDASGNSSAIVGIPLTGLGGSP
jgi:hypothetical protein